MHEVEIKDDAARRLARRALRPHWASRNFQLIFVARVAMSTGRALAGVVVPIYLALEGFSAFKLAEYVLVVALASAAVSALVGLWSDQVGRRVFLVVVPVLTAFAGAGFAFSASTPVLFLLGALGSFGRGSGAGAGAIGPYQPAESAFVTEVIEPRHRNSAFGRLSFGSALGATAGGLLALLAPAGHVHARLATETYRPAFLAIAAASLLAGLLALGLAEPRQHRRRVFAGQPPRRRRSRSRLPQKSRWLLYRLWVTNTANGLAVGMFGPFVTYWFFRRFNAGPERVGALFAVINVATMASTLSAAGLARRWGLVRTVSVVRTAQAVLLVPMALSPSFLVAGAVYLVRMMVQRVGLPLRQSYALALADPSERASVAALSNLPSQLATAASPMLAGYLMEEVSLSVPFEVAAALQFVNASTFYAFFRNAPPEEELAGSQVVGTDVKTAPQAEDELP
ncbi:MAG: MFS transporter [Acidimicrobiales bacterium]